MTPGYSLIKRLVTCFLSLVTLASCAVAPVSYVITDDDLRKMPDSAAASVDWLNRYCEVRGKPVNLFLDKRVFFATTFPADCGWGAGNGPLFLIMQTKDGYRSILKTQGAAMKVLETRTNSFFDIEIYGTHLATVYQYDGNQYVFRTQYPLR